MAAAIIGGGGWTRLRGIDSGASGAAVSLAIDDASGELFVVKSACSGERAGAAKQQLRREWGVMSELSSPHVLRCLGFVAGDDEHRLFLEFAPGGSLADVAARNGGRLDEVAVRAYAADMVRGLDYLHGKRVVHGDLKGSNVLVGADGRAKLADFGCSKKQQQSTAAVIGGTPAFMAPEVARGEEQGPAADVWALGCTVVEIATGRAPWSGADNVLAALRMIGYTDGAVPEVPPWMSPEAKDFLNKCLQRRSGDRATAAQLLQHPFVSTSSCGVNNMEVVKATWVSPTSALDAALWESESTSSSSLTGDEEDDDLSSNSNSPISRIRAMACSGETLPDWDSDRHCWIEVISSDANLNITYKTTATAADNNESSECLAAKMVIRSMASSPSSVPADWGSHQGWIDVLGASPAVDNEEFDVESGADEIFSEALGSIVVGVGSEQSVVAENQEVVFTSLSSCSERVLLVAAHAADNVASRKAGIKPCSNFSS
uniref:Protein kinase domain-containing protein n=1 Tax=Leersia perrieri TaxID=77586 RepID=A0A0D9XHJ0_9ORYZ